jgi:hypothetical protein
MIAGLHSPRRKPQVNAMDQVFGTYTRMTPKTGSEEPAFPPDQAGLTISHET